jgi:hypothetical protein
MTRKILLRRIVAAAAVFSFAAAAYSFLWGVSSSSLAFADCRGTFAIDAENFRCARPIWLTYAFWAFIVLGGALKIGYVALREAADDSA